MSREYKFRAWDGTEMYTPILADGKIYRCGRDFEDGNDAPHDNLMQYTGLKDKMGTGIYEGDILKVPDLYETPENTSMTYHNEIIRFSNCAFRLGNQLLCDYAEYVADECEVIGSKYTHPHLLKEGEGCSI
ncbi:YopX family protein [Paenibacillus pasadenensis]|uniref:YopX family protein n=1 Tax=Paenibacillus pasadenensis TaxID=217090 RepID=UPI00203FD6A7|nr:YopX family protein [Paenibacillus pasadenensis]